MRGKAARLAQVTWRSVRAWVPGQEACVVAVTPVWVRERGRVLARRMWSWRQERGGGRPLRADARGAAVGVAALLLAGEPGEPGGSQ